VEAGVYQNLQRAAEAVLADIDAKKGMQYWVAQYGVWRTESLAWIQTNIEAQQKLLEAAQKAHADALAKAQEGLAELQAQIQTIEAQIQQYATLRDQARANGNFGLADYYNDLMAQGVTQKAQVNGDITQANNYIARLNQKTDTSIDENLDLVNAQNGLAEWQARQREIPTTEDWKKDPRGTSKKWAEMQFEMAKQELVDAYRGIEYVNAKINNAQRGLAETQAEYQAAIKGYQALNDEQSTMEAANNFEPTADKGSWSISWIDWQQSEAQTKLDNFSDEGMTPEEAARQRKILQMPWIIGQCALQMPGPVPRIDRFGVGRPAS
jgi:chromosome segregation ATPase